MTRIIITALLVAFLMVSCGSAVTIPPYDAVLPSDTSLPTDTSVPTVPTSPTSTATPPLTPTPQLTATAEPPYIPEGTIFYLWGSDFDWGNPPPPYLVWGAPFRDVMNGNCQGFICGGKDLREYGGTVWQFIGRGVYGEAVFTFATQLDTFVVVWNNRLVFDALSGTTIDGDTVAYGYLADGTVTASYMDGSNFPMLTIVGAEEKHMPVKEPCGIIDPNPDGDNNYNLTGNHEGWLGGAIVWSFLDRGFYNSPYATRKGYSLTSLTIISQPVSIISSDQICP